MARQRAAATAGLLAAGSIALPFVVATPALAAPGQVFGGQGSATFLTVDAGVDTAGLDAGIGDDLALGLLVQTLLDGLEVDDSVQLAGVQVGQAVASTASLGTPQSTAGASAVNATLAGLLDIETDLAEVTASTPDDLGPNEDELLGIDLPGLLDAGVITNAAVAANLDADLCSPAGDPTAQGVSTTASAAVLPGALGSDGLIASTTAVEANSRTGLVDVDGQDGLGVQTVSELGVVDLAVLDDVVGLDLTSGSLTTTASGPAAGTVVYVPPALTVDAAGDTYDGVVAPGDTVVIPVTVDNGVLPFVSLVVTLSDAEDVVGDVNGASVDILSLSLVVDLDGSAVDVIAPVTLLDVTVGSLEAGATAPEGGVLCGVTPPTTPPVTTPPGTTTPVVNPIAGGPARPAALANTGAEPLPMLGLGLGLLAVGGAALGAGPLRRRMNSSTPSA